MWREIPSFEGLYEVSDAGEVRRMVDMGRGGGWKAGGLLTPSQNNQGYMGVTLTKNGIQYTGKMVHQLVMLAFAGEPPEGYQINHKNGIKMDNRLENLEYVTPKENVRHAFDVLGHTNPKGAEARAAKIGDATARYIYDAYHAGGVTLKKLANETGFSVKAVWCVVRKLTWTHIHEEND